MNNIILREEKQSPLTHQELDTNFEILNPVGVISAFARILPPPGWLECNGQEVSRSEYTKLFEAMGTMFGEGDGETTFNLPDLRGEFIRGWDNERGIDSGREIGSYQGHLFASHTHEVRQKHSSGYIGNAWVPDVTYNRSNYAHNTMSTGGNETRPRNIALMYCIKY